ncbi:hypothetical protein IQ26_07533 [Mesorhizobium tianshanense]|uniref:Uncharacterized protein n=1 Tax=Mesorhizobium tianshanense TaxID=39844 RepID=A0A562MBI5_9HYPH|nr:hypothetical protein IQ26_07533 [Mesorhizobium tianshanense]
MTPSATLPSRARCTPPRPWLPITMRSAGHSPAAFTISSAGIPATTNSSAAGCAATGADGGLPAAAFRRAWLGQSIRLAKCRCRHHCQGTRRWRGQAPRQCQANVKFDTHLSGVRGNRLTIDCNKGSSNTHGQLPRSASKNEESPPIGSTTNPPAVGSRVGLSRRFVSIVRSKEPRLRHFRRHDIAEDDGKDGAHLERRERHEAGAPRAARS